MAKNRNALRAGTLIILSVMAVIALAVTIRGTDTFTVPVDVRSVKFALTDDVGGLRAGDDVRVGGFKVGEVHAITVEGPDKPGEDPYIRVTYTFPKKYVLRDDAVLRIQGTLTGLSWMNYESLGTGKLLAVDDRSFRGRKSSTSELIDSLAEMKQPLQRSLNNVGDITQTVKDTTLTKVNATLADFDHTAVDVRAQIDPAFKKYHAIGDHAITMMDKIGAFFGDATTDFRATIANANKLTHTFNEKLPSLLDRVNGILVNLDTSVKSANQALEDIKVTLGNSKDISATARSVIVGNKGKFETMIAALKATSDNLKNATAEVRRSPWRLLYKPNSGEMANLNLYDATRQFADGATDLNDAALALRDAVQDKDVDKEQLQKLMKKLDKSFTNFTAVEQTLWEKVKE